MLASSSLPEIIAHLRGRLDAGEQRIELEVLDPDRAAGRYAGERVLVEGVAYVHRPYRAWVDLAERLGLRMLTPQAGAPPCVRLRFERLEREARLGARGAGAAEVTDVTERYGASSEFARVDKGEDPHLVIDLAEALERITPRPGARVLDLGVNDGDELALLMALSPALASASFVGVDHSASALAVARRRFGDRVALHQADLGALDSLALGRFDLVLSIGTLQSPGIDDRALLRRIMQEHVEPDGAVLLGLPNCRYVDGEVEHGARMKNFRQPELGLLFKDVAFYRKYLQQHRRKVYVTGKNYILVTGVADGATEPARRSP